MRSLERMGGRHICCNFPIRHLKCGFLRVLQPRERPTSAMARKAQNEFVKCTACTPKGTPRYSTAPTGTFGIGPVGQAVPRGTVQLCPWPKGFCPAVPFGCTGWYRHSWTQNLTLVALVTVPRVLVQFCSHFSPY